MAKCKDALILTAITLIAGLLLGGVYELTRKPIEQQQIAANAEAYHAVCPNAAAFSRDSALSTQVERSQEILEASSLAMGNVAVEEALYGYDASGNVTGLVVKSTSKDGYGGAIRIVVGLLPEENGITVTGIDFLEINETAGLGMRATEPAFAEQYKDKTVDSFEVVKNGAAESYQIDALSGATKTSSAVTNAVNAALVFAAALEQ